MYFSYFVLILFSNFKKKKKGKLEQVYYKVVKSCERLHVPSGQTRVHRLVRCKMLDFHSDSLRNKRKYLDK